MHTKMTFTLPKVGHDEQPDATRVCDGILSAVGNTPLIRLRRLLPETRFQLFAKLEALNPGGSIKDRPALAILEHALRSGKIGPDTVVIESSSGNMGIGLAQACRYHGLRFLCVVDRKTVRGQPPDAARLRRGDRPGRRARSGDAGNSSRRGSTAFASCCATSRRSFWPNQYANLQNPASHYSTTMHEVATALDGKVDFLFVATSTCGTIRGCVEYVAPVRAARPG